MDELQFPDLPPLQGEILLNVYTHRSLRMSDGSVDNERYAVLGEKVLEAEITYYIFACHPKYDRKAIEAERLSLLSDSNYTTWVNHYKMRDKLRYNPSAFDDIYSFGGAREIFHAYVGGLYSQANGPMTVNTWVFELVTSPEQRSEMAKNPSQYQLLSTNRSHSPPPPSLPHIDYYSTCSQPGPRVVSSAPPQSYPDAMLKYDAPPLVTNAPPLVTSVPLPPPKTHTAYLPRFNEIATKRRLDVQWHAEQIGLQHSPRWNVVCIVNGKACGSGSAPAKQLAKEEAAKQTFQILGLESP